jgi:hypothetical protein
MNIGKSAALAALLLSSQAFADTFETTTRETQLPGDRNGSLVVRKCPSCAPTLARLDERSTFRVGDTDVDFQTFADYVHGTGERFLNVSYDARTGAVTRLRVDGRLQRRAR